MVGVYSLQCKCGLMYIGGSKDIEERYKQHRNDYTNPNRKYYNSKCYNHIRECNQCSGFDDVTFTIIEECSIDEVDSREDYYVTLYDSVKNGMNSRGGGKCGKHSEETKEKMSNSHKGKKLTDVTKQKISVSKSGEGNSFYGKKHTDETKQRIGECNRGRVVTEETKKLLSDVKSGEGNPNSKLTEDVVRMIKIDYRDGLKVREIFEKYNTLYPQLTINNVNNIVYGYRWKNVTID